MKMLRYSEIPRDISGDNLATLKIPEPIENYKCKNDETKSASIKSRKISDPVISGGPRPPYYYCNYGSLAQVPVHVKTQSLPNHSSQRSTTTTATTTTTAAAATTNTTAAPNYSCAIFDILRIPPEDFANQLTILDLKVFLNIQPDELTSCAWNKKNKLTVAPNVVAFSRRFNHISFWVVQEILTRSTPKQRSEVLSFFIRIAKKLYDLNNLHSLFAIISALQSASVYRLTKTWSCLSKKDKQCFDKLAEVFSDADNWSKLRSHMESLKLPCIPYLGLYLTDLVYIDMAHPHSGGLESQQRQLKMNNILRVISNYQHSDYSHLQVVPHIQDYLNSIRYIEELQKFVEDDQYKLSLKLEPISPAASSSSCSSKESVITDSAAIASLNLSPAKASSGSLRLHAVTSANKFIPSHRKCRSLGTNIFNKSYQVGSFDPKELPKAVHLLDDSVLEDTVKNLHINNDDLSVATGNLSLQASQNTAENCTLLTRLGDDSLSTDGQFCSMQGCIRRKTVLKEGRKPTVSSWQRYWVQIWTSSLVYFSPKSFKGSRIWILLECLADKKGIKLFSSTRHQRSDFKSEPCKLVSLIGCQIIMNTMQQDSFQIVDHQRGNIYKFRAGTKNLAEKWCQHLQQATANGEQQTPLPTNLMSFE